MTNDKQSRLLASLETGFRTDAAHLKALEQDLARTLQNIRHFGAKQGSPEHWKINWNQQWDGVEDILSRIRTLVQEMEGSIESSDRDRLKLALQTWETIQGEDVKLVAALKGIQAQTTGLNAVVRKDWHVLARTLESHLEIIDACAQALRIKLELLKEHSKAEVDQLVQDIFSKLPHSTQAEGDALKNFELEYRRAASELKLERHKFLGFMDVVKGMLLWVETTEERERKNLSHEVDTTRTSTLTNGAGSIDSRELTPVETEKSNRS